MGDNIPNTEPSTTVNPVYDEIKNSAPYEDSLNKQWLYNKEPALTATPDTPPYKPTSTIIDETFADMPGYTEMKNSFDRDRFNSEVEKSLEGRQQYSSGTGIFRKLYDDGNQTTLNNTFTGPSTDKYPPTYAREENTSSVYYNKNIVPVTEPRGEGVGSRISPDMTPKNGKSEYDDTIPYHKPGTENINDTIPYHKPGTENMDDTIPYHKPGTENINDTIPYHKPGTENIDDTIPYHKPGTENIDDTIPYHKPENRNSSEQDENGKSEYDKSNIVIAGNLQVDFSKIDRIIEILKEVKDSKIPSAKSYVGDQVMLINNVPDFTSAVGRLDSTDINQPLTNLAAKIEKLINDYEYVKGEVKKYNSKSTGALAGAFTTLIGRNNSSSSEPPVENVWRPSSTTTTTSTEAPTDVKTPQTTPQTEVKTTPTTERPTVPVTTEPTTTTPQTTEPVKHGGPLPSIPVNRNTNGNGTSGGGYYWNGSGNGTNNTVTTEAPTVATEATFDIKEGNKYKLPTSSRPTTPTTQPPTSSKGNSVIPVLAGLSAAAAAGIGAKAYMDRKKNNDNESEEEFKSEDWSDNNDINIEYQEPVTKEAETLEFDDVNDNYEVETPEKYGAKTHQELEDLQ